MSSRLFSTLTVSLAIAAVVAPSSGSLIFYVPQLSVQLFLHPNYQAPALLLVAAAAALLVIEIICLI